MDNFFQKCGLPNCHFLLLSLLLMVSDPTLSYLTAPLGRVCTRDEDLSNDVEFQPDSQFFRQRSMVLGGSGNTSAALLLAKMSDPPCSLVVEVPKDSHAITVFLSNFPESIPCPLSLWSQDSINKNETWFLDLCDEEKRRLLAYYPEVYPHRITLRWNAKVPGRYSSNDPRLMRILSSEEPVEIVVTAIARGSLCDEESRVLCWKMNTESLCISEEFACDGKNNCPRPWNDEFKSMCSQRRNGDFEQLKTKSNKVWDILTDHLKRILAVSSGNPEMVNSGDNRPKGFGVKQDEMLHVGGATIDYPDGERELEVGKEDGEVERRLGILGVLPRLGPGSYVLLGMLTCGSVLLLCGLWECCCRVRNQAATISVSQRGSLVTTGSNGQGTTTTVVIISSIPPPQYEELEQPPKYKELFPARSKSSTNVLAKTN